MDLGDQTKNDLIEAIAHAAAIPAYNADLYISLHTADPGDAGSQDTSEATYTGYARQAVPRTVGGWNVTGGSAVTVSPVTFPLCTGGGPETITHFSVGTDLAGPGQILFHAALPAPKIVDTGDTPAFNSVTMSFE